MFGKRKRLESKAEHGDASRGYATVLHVSRVIGPIVNSAAVGGTFRVKVSVEPALGEAFETHMTVRTDSVSLTPHEGERIPVLYSGDSVVWDEEAAKTDFQQASGAKLKLSDPEKDRFRATLLGKLDDLRAKGKIGDSEYLAKKAEIEADPDLSPSA
jgi:hypothetical protein